MKLDANNVDEYFKAVPPERQASMNALRKLILAECPKLVEEFQYNLPLYNLDGKQLFALASQKHHISFYVSTHDLLKKHKPHIGKASTGKSCARYSKPEHIDFGGLTNLIREAYAQVTG